MIKCWYCGENKMVSCGSELTKCWQCVACGATQTDLVTPGRSCLTVESSGEKGITKGKPTGRKVRRG